MGYDIKTENYKKNVGKLVKEWNKDMKPLIDQVDRLEGEVNQLSGKEGGHGARPKAKAFTHENEERQSGRRADFEEAWGTAGQERGAQKKDGKGYPGL